ncbi:DUF4184 family protein [Pontibacter brevis]
MAPDFEKFLKLEGGNSYSHTWGSIFWFSLPLGIILSFVFHLVVRDTLIDNLPGFMRKRLARFKKLNWKVYFKEHFLVIMVSIILGALTHIIWDGFTHKDGPDQNQPTLLPDKASLSVLPVPLFFFLNIMSSVIGFVIVLYAILKLPKEDAVEETNRTKAYWPVVGIIILAVLSIRFATGVSFREILRLEGDFWDFIITLVAAFFFSLVAAPLVLRMIGLAGNNSR